MVKPGYKQTELGIIPEDWDYTVWENAGSGFSSGATPYRGIKRYYSGNVKWVSSGELNYNVINETLEHISDEAKTKTNLKLHPANTFLMAITGLEAAGTRGSCAILGVPATTNQSCMAVYETDRLNIRYLFYFYSKNGDDLAFKYCQGTKQQSYTAAIVKKLPIILPPVSEQKRIAEALSDVDSMISSLEKLIAKKKGVKQGVMQELLTGKKRLPGFDGEWDDYTIGKMGEFYSGLSGKSKKDFDCGDAYYITFLNVLSNVKIDTSILASVDVRENESQNIVRKGDLFFNTSSETPEEVGMCAVLDEELENTYLNSFCFGFRLFDDAHNPLFLSYYLNSSIGRKIMSILAQGATRYNLSKNNFAETVIKLPTKEEQTAIASILSDMDNEIETLEQKLEKTRQIKQGMMQQLLTGKIRLASGLAESKSIEIVSKPHHNHQFDDAVVIAAIVNEFYTDGIPLGRKKVQKLLYLLRRKQEADTSTFKKKAAGPYADEVRYKGGEPIAVRNKYVAKKQGVKGTTFSKGEKIESALEYIEKWEMTDDINWLVSTFKYTKTNDLELFATIDMAICDLLNVGEAVSVASIKNLIASNKEWKDKLSKTYFSDNDIARAIRFCQSTFN